MSPKRKRGNPNWATKLEKVCKTCGKDMFYGQCRPCFDKLPKEPRSREEFSNDGGAILLNWIPDWQKPKD